MNHRLRRTFFLVASALIGFSGSTSAAANAPEETGQGMELGAPFSDHAVLQRELPVPVWGWSKPGTEVTVEFAGLLKLNALHEETLSNRNQSPSGFRNAHTQVHQNS